MTPYIPIREIINEFNRPITEHRPHWFEGVAPEDYRRTVATGVTESEGLAGSDLEGIKTEESTVKPNI